MPRLVVVSNRVPSATGTNAGGLAVALKAALAEAGGVWFGWSGRTVDNPDPEPKLKPGKGFTLATIDLTKSEVAGYYAEFANRCLWPLFHGRLDLCRFDHEAYDTYRRVNARFAEALSRELMPGDVIWIHDYHLIPLGAELRRLGVTAPIGFFLHIPFPQGNAFTALPWHRELLDAFGAYDLLGFQTRECQRDFGQIVERMGGKFSDDGIAAFAGRIVKVRAFPIGIDAAAFAALAASPAVHREIEKLRASAGDRMWIAGVERLDYTKGLPERFRAFETLLEQSPELHGRVSLIQVAAPSRESVDEYRKIRASLEQLTGRINGEYATFDWTPIRCLHRSFNHIALASLFHVSRVGLVTPLRDGMNLVAKEYIAAQDPEDPGVLILSQFAGAAEELKDALIVNPYDAQSVADAMRRAIVMPRDERIERWRRMMSEIGFNDVHRWRRAFLQTLAAGPSGARGAVIHAAE